MAAEKGHLEVVTILLDSGVNVDAIGPNGKTALHYAALAGQVHTVQSLLNSGASSDLKTTAGLTPLDGARSRNNQSVVELLTAAALPEQVQETLSIQPKFKRVVPAAAT